MTPISYFLPGTEGLTSTFGDRPTALWEPPQPVLEALPPDGGQSNGFGLRIFWAVDGWITLEVSANPGGAYWQPLTTKGVAGGWTDVADPDWTSYPARFYRVHSQ